MAKVLIVTGDAGESYESLYAVHRFKEEGWQPVVAAPSLRRLNMVIHDFKPGWDTYIERRGYGLASDLTFDQVVVDDYDAILVLGGRAPEYLRNDIRLRKIVQAFSTKGKWVWAICHGIQILAAAGLVKGKRITCYEHCRYEAEQAGGQWIPQEAVCDGKLITAQTWQSHPDFYREIFARYAEKSDAASRS
jgi:protease I